MEDRRLKLEDMSQKVEDTRSKIGYEDRRKEIAEKDNTQKINGIRQKIEDRR